MVKGKRISGLVLTGFLLANFGVMPTAHAIGTTSRATTSVARSTGATSAARSAATRSAATRGTMTRSTATRSIGSRMSNSATRSAGSRMSASRSLKPTSEMNTSRQSIRAQRAGQRAMRSSTYRSLPNSSARRSYVSWHEHYYNNSYRYFTSVRYFWMPFNIWNSLLVQQQQHQDRLASNMKIVAQRKGYKWIKVNDKMVAVPDKVYNQVNVGDKIKLIDQNHIEINGKLVR